MQIKVHKPTDFQQLAELRWILKAEEDSGIAHVEQASFIRNYCDQLKLSESIGDTVHWVIEDPPILVGALTIRIVRKELSPGSEAGAWGYLTNVFVREDFRARGIGSQLLNQAIGWAVDQHLELLIVWPSERSYSFYRRAGFVGESDPLELVLHPDGT